MEWITIVYLIYIFIAFYFFSLFFLIYIRNRKTLFNYPPIQKHFSISAIVPCWNEGRNVLETVKAIMKTDYDNLKEIILVNDGSTDNTLEYMLKAKKQFKIIKILNKENSGKADSINQALKIAKGELVAIIDADSFPKSDVFSKLVGYFEDSKIGVVTVPHLSRRKENFLDRVHTYYQILVATNRKFLEILDGVYVTPGPMSLYRKKALEDIGGFDTENITEDIEATWHLAKNGWKRKMCLATTTTTLLPNTLKKFFNQRVRWSIGGLQTAAKYKKEFFKSNMVSYFILPYFILSIFLGIFAIFFFLFLFGKRIFESYIFFNSIYITNGSFFSLFEFNFFPHIIFILSIFLIIITSIFSLLMLMMLEENFLKTKNIKFFFVYLIFLGIIQSVIFITAIFKFIKKDIKW